MAEFFLTPGGSSRGISYWKSVLPCPRQHYFRYREFPDSPKTWGQGAEVTGKLQAFMVGTLVHAYLEAFHTVGSTSRLVFVDAEGPLKGFSHEETEAWRLAAAYIKEYKTSEFEQCQAEVDIEDTSGELGVPLITGRVDLVAWFGGGVLPGSDTYLPAGRYIIDHKTASSKSNYLDKEHLVQLSLYQHMWNKQFPEKQVIGAIVNNIIKTKVPSFERKFVPPPNNITISNLTKSLSFAYLIHEQHAQEMNTSACTSDWSPCSHYARCWT
jgi:hypothetical protein